MCRGRVHQAKALLGDPGALYRYIGACRHRVHVAVSHHLLDDMASGLEADRVVAVLIGFRLPRESAEMLNICMVFLPPYSLDLNSIEYIWKDIKKVISTHFITCKEEMRTLINDTYAELSKKNPTQTRG